MKPSLSNREVPGPTPVPPDEASPPVGGSPPLTGSLLAAGIGTMALAKARRIAVPAFPAAAEPEPDPQERPERPEEPKEAAPGQ